MANKIKIKLYRHKTEKDFYLARNWNYCGGGDTTPFYYATQNVVEAVAAANRKGFTEWMSSFLGDDMKTKLTAKIIIKKEMEFDGYKGVLAKELSFPVKEFELVELTEAADE